MININDVEQICLLKTSRFLSSQKKSKNSCWTKKKTIQQQGK